MSAEPEDADGALAVLRDVWSAQGQDAAALDEALGPARSCQRMSDVGFDGLAGANPDADANANGGLRAAWKETLRRDGKLAAGSASLLDLVRDDTKTSSH